MATASDAVQCLMLTVAILAAFSCISRPDYNFPLYLYLWWAFFYVPEGRKVCSTSTKLQELKFFIEGLPHYNEELPLLY